MNISGKQLLIAVGAVAGIAIIWIAWSYRPVAIRNLDSTGTTIVAFGDSLVYGRGSSPGNDFVSLLSDRIGEPIVNLGINGWATSDGLRRVGDIFAYNPKLVILLLGGNDVLRRISERETFDNLGKIIEAIQSHGAAVLLLGVRGGLLIDSYDDQYKRLSRQYQTGYVPNVLDGLLGTSDFMSDPVHPNDTGYRKIADKVEPVLRKMLR